MDFAQKRRMRRSDGWAIRTVKLSFSRKLTYVAGLLACFGCADVGIEVDLAQERTPLLIEHLEAVLSRTPLEVFAMTAAAYWHVETLRSAWREIFDTYEQFLEIMDHEEGRRRLETLSEEAAATDPVFGAAREARNRFRIAIERVFFDGTGTPFPSWTRRYGVF